jgi:hypothetical protein
MPFAHFTHCNNSTFNTQPLHARLLSNHLKLRDSVQQSMSQKHGAALSGVAHLLLQLG